MCAGAGFGVVVIFHHLCESGGNATGVAVCAVFFGAVVVVICALVPLGLAHCGHAGACPCVGAGGCEQVACCNQVAGRGAAVEHGVADLVGVLAEPPAHVFRHVFEVEVAIVNHAEHLLCAIVGSGNDEAAVAAVKYVETIFVFVEIALSSVCQSQAF